MDVIRIKNLKISARHGAYEFEKDKEGLFELDIEMYMNLKTPARTDDLNDTANYDKAISLITSIFTQKSYNLIEAVAEKICLRLLDDYPIERVLVRIRKPHAPILAGGYCRS